MIESLKNIGFRFEYFGDSTDYLPECKKFTPAIHLHKAETVSLNDLFYVWALKASKADEIWEKYYQERNLNVLEQYKEEKLLEKVKCFEEFVKKYVKDCPIV